MQTSNTPSGGPLGQFITQHSEKVTGVLEGFDRVRVQASLRSLYHASVMEYYLLSPTRQGGFDHLSCSIQKFTFVCDQKFTADFST
jgi:hypothetical protein